MVGLVLALRRALRCRDWAVGAGTSVLLVLLMLSAGYYMWWGGAAAGPRHLIPGVAFLAAAVVFIPLIGRPWSVRAIVVLAGASILNALATALVGVEAPERGDVLRDFVWARMQAGRIAGLSGASNLGLKAGLSAMGSVLAIVAWVALGYVYLNRQLRKTGNLQRPAT
jgi:hypothetical protein